MGHRIEINALFDAIDQYNTKPDKALGEFNRLCASRTKLACLLSGQSVNWYPGAAIMQAPSREGEAQFVVAYEGSSTLRFVVQNVEDKSIIFPLHERLIQPEYAMSGLYHIQFKNNQLSDKNFRLVVFNELGQLIDYREFSWQRPGKDSLKWVVLSCMKDSLKNTEEIWDVVEKVKADLYLMIGDNSYLTSGLKSFIGMDEDRIWTRHMQTRMKLKFFRFKNLSPVLATWDDHDYGKNDGGKDFKNKAVSARIFREFFPLNYGNPKNTGPGLSFNEKYGNHNFVFLDNRSFREVKNKKGSHLGQKQNQWMINSLDRKKWNWIIKGDQYYGGYHPFESFQGNHPGAFSSWVKDLKRKNYPFSFVSGDRHLSEIIEIPKNEFGSVRYEFTSSPVHSSVYPGGSLTHKNPWRKVSVDGKWNFLIFQSQKKATDLEVKVESLGLEGDSYFKENFKFKLQ